MKINDKELTEKSKIYNPKTRPLNKYENVINEAAKSLCAKDAFLLTNRKQLVEKATEKVDSSGYTYVKGKSQSKLFSTGTDSKAAKKRPYMTAEIRETRIASLTDQIKSVEETMSLLQKQKEQYVTSNKFMQAAEINTLISVKGAAKTKLQEELSRLNMASSQAIRHKRRKTTQ